jgi:predicted transcriptional regulator
MISSAAAKSSGVVRRHLRVAHGLDVAVYRIRWNPPADCPVTAPGYSTALDDGQGDAFWAPARH